MLSTSRPHPCSLGLLIAPLVFFRPSFSLQTTAILLPIRFTKLSEMNGRRPFVFISFVPMNTKKHYPERNSRMKNSRLIRHGRFDSARKGVVRIGALALSLSCFVLSTPAQTLIYQEGFNSDGETNVPPRYTTIGRDVYEVARIKSELIPANPPNVADLWNQKGPIYFAHNFNVSYVGIPTIPARRMILTWRTDPAGGAATADLLQVFDSSINWLLNGKTNATIVVSPNRDAINELAARLEVAGHMVVSDDATTYPDEQDVPGDLFIHGPGAAGSRFAMVPKP